MLVTTETPILPSTPTPQSPSSPLAISVRGVGKMHRIYDRPQDRLKQMLWRGRRSYGREFWALRGVSFDVQQGESVGIIGRNGSGKSTLLQIIAGTMTPTEGEVQVNGRVAALLELGSGFNPEFTGRENVFLNGAILGIERAEMERRFDDIAAFADIGQFIDQPVKTYSSGMYARLAFSVAISVDPDILIVDEILAVGDIQFQQKCVSRLRELKENGLTLLFVGHSVDTLKSVCNRGILISDGRTIFQGSAEQATDAYLNFIRDKMNEENRSQVSQLSERPAAERAEPVGYRRYGTGHVLLDGVSLTDEGGEPRVAFFFGEVVVLHVRYHSLIDVDNLSVSFLVRDITGVDLMGTTTFDEHVALPTAAAGQPNSVQFRFTNALRYGSYGMSVAITRVTQRDYSDNIVMDQIDGAAAFETLGRSERPVHYKFHQPVEIRIDQ